MGVPVVSSADFAVPAFGDAVQLAVDAGLTAAAILDAAGKILAVAGMLDDEEDYALASHAAHHLRTRHLLDRMRDGEMIHEPLGDRDVRIGIASNFVFVVVFPRNPATVPWGAVQELRSDIARAVQRANVQTMPLPMSGGGGSGPVELPAEVEGTGGRRSSKHRIS